MRVPPLPCRIYISSFCAFQWNLNETPLYVVQTKTPILILHHNSMSRCSHGEIFNEFQLNWNVTVRFKVSAFLSDTSLKSRAPLSDGTINDRLVKMVSTLQQCGRPRSSTTSPSFFRASHYIGPGAVLRWWDVITSAIPSTPPWLLTRPVVNFTLHCSDKSNTPPEIFKHRFYELCHESWV